MSSVWCSWTLSDVGRTRTGPLSVIQLRKGLIPGGGEGIGRAGGIGKQGEYFSSSIGFRKSGIFSLMFGFGS